MSNLVKRPWLLLPLLLLTLQCSWGQAPSGSYDFAFNSPNTAVYDLSGAYNFDQQIIGAGGTLTQLNLDSLNLIHDSSGRLHGTGIIQVDVGDSSVAANYTANGRVSGGGNAPVVVSLWVHLSGNDTVSSLGTRFSISIRYNFVVDPGSMSLVGTAKGRANFSSLGSGRIDSQNVVVPLQSGMDGTWSAQLELSTLSRISGGGSIVLSNGRSLPVHASGTYIPVSQRSIVRLNGYLIDGDNDGRSSTVRLSLFPTDSGLQVDTLNGIILGQRVVQ